MINLMTVLPVTSANNPMPPPPVVRFFSNRKANFVFLLLAARSPNAAAKMNFPPPFTQASGNLFGEK
jgi:hypothetical protein